MNLSNPWLVTVSSADHLRTLQSLPRQAFVQRAADMAYERRSGLGKTSKGLQAGNSFYSTASSRSSETSTVGDYLSKKEIELHQIKSDELRAHNNAHTFETWASFNKQTIQKPADLFA